MARYLLCSFALVLLYLAGMATAMLFAGRVADRSGRRPVALFGAVVFVLASALCALAQESSLFLLGRFVQGFRAGNCYVVAFAILRDTLDDQRRAKVLSLLNGITCIVPLLAPVMGHLIMLSYPWQSLFWTMLTMGVLVFLLSLLVLKETRPDKQQHATGHSAPSHESLLDRFFLSRLAITTLSVSVILTFVNTSPVRLMEMMGFGVAMSQALGPFALRAGVASSVLGIAQVCGSSLWIWLAAVLGLNALNMLIGILIACSILSLLLILAVTPNRIIR